VDHPVNVICFLSSRVSKDNKRYDINVETIPAKFAPQKKVSHSYVADDYVKSIKLVLNKTMVSQKPSKQVSSFMQYCRLKILSESEKAKILYFTVSTEPRKLRNCFRNTVVFI